MRGTAACVGMRVAWIPPNRGSSALDASGKRAGSAAQGRGTAVSCIGGSCIYTGTLRDTFLIDKSVLTWPEVKYNSSTARSRGALKPMNCWLKWSHRFELWHELGSSIAKEPGRSGNLTPYSAALCFAKHDHKASYHLGSGALEWDNGTGDVADKKPLLWISGDVIFVYLWINQWNAIESLSCKSAVKTRRQ